MIDSVWNLLFRCPHKRVTRPITPVSKAGVPHGDTYVVCLDCGKQFIYDLKKMRIDKPVHSTEAAGVLHPNMPKPRTSKLKLAALASACRWPGWLVRPSSRPRSVRTNALLSRQHSRGATLRAWIGIGLNPPDCAGATSACSS